MAHFPKPFFRPKKNRWYVQLDGKQITLAETDVNATRKGRIRAGPKGRCGCESVRVIPVACLMFPYDSSAPGPVGLLRFLADSFLRCRLASRSR